MTRSIFYEDIREATYRLCVETLFHLREDIFAELERAISVEEEPARHYLEILWENAEIASEGQIPITQDAGLPQFFVEMGHDLVIEEGTLQDALREGLKQFVQSHPFRIPILDDPLDPDNVKTDHMPLRLHLEHLEGDALRIRCIRIPTDSELMSRVGVFPSCNLTQQLHDFVLETVSGAEAHASPPFLVGIGLGGTVAESATLAKKALLRPIGKPPTSLQLARIEKDILQKINDLKIGPGGLGGETTTLAVHIASSPTMPDAVPISVRIVGNTPCISEVLF